jgi:predicted site-specific integrase-resolvase
MRILRPKDAARALGIHRDTLYEKFVRTGRVRWVKISDKAVGVPEDEIDQLIEEMRATRDGKLNQVA